jgi:hypothetical protein
MFKYGYVPETIRTYGGGKLSRANLGTLISKRVEFKECPGCGRVFPPISGKLKYHDPQCATRTRQRKWKRDASENG